MEAKTRRKYTRQLDHVPILYAGYDFGSYNEAVMINSCQDGMYFESGTPVQPQRDIFIKILKERHKGFESEQYKAFRARVKWCCQLAGGKIQIYGTGVQYTAKSHLVYGTNILNSNYLCDYCDHIVTDRRVHLTESGLVLCKDCLNYIETLPDSIVNAVERVLKGNVV